MRGSSGWGRGELQCIQEEMNRQYEVEVRREARNISSASGTVS